MTLHPDYKSYHDRHQDKPDMAAMAMTMFLGYAVFYFFIFHPFIYKPLMAWMGK